MHKCRYCDQPLDLPFLDLGVMALANSFLSESQLNEKESTYPLGIIFCRNCGLVQLSHVVPPEKMFSNYFYVSSTTTTFKKHFADYAKDVISRFPPNQPLLAVDIGSNDGLLLTCFTNEGIKAVGAEPAKNLADEANGKGIETYNYFFSRTVTEKIISEHGQADIITANNVFAHIDNIKGILENVNYLLSENGLFVIEFPYLCVMYEKMFFDMIYHEHLSYIYVKPLTFMLQKFGLEIYDISMVESHGGSLRVFVQKVRGIRQPKSIVEIYLNREENEGYYQFEKHQKFASQVNEVKKVLITFVEKALKEGKTISGYGAPAKGNTIINFCGFNSSQIKYLIEDNPLKQNTWSPGARIPIKNRDYFLKNPTDYIIIFAWNFAKEIIAKTKDFIPPKTNFIVPLPKPVIIDN